MKPEIHHENNWNLCIAQLKIISYIVSQIDWLIDWFNVDLNSQRKYSIIKRLRQNVCWLECTSCKYTRLYSERHALYHIFLTWNGMYNSNYSTIKLQLCDNSDRVPTEPLEEYLWSDMAGFQPPTNSLHGLPVASCHKNNNSGQSFDTGVCRKSKKPPVGVHTATTFCCFSLSIMRFTQYL